VRDKQPVWVILRADMFRGFLLLGTALALAHLLTVVSCVGAHLGIARAARDVPDRNPIALRAVTASGDALMFPISVAWWLWRGERFPNSTDAVWLASPIWGLGLAYVVKRRERKRTAAPGNGDV
jgi:hypothetical protein